MSGRTSAPPSGLSRPVLGFLGGTGPQGRGLAVRFAAAGFPCLLGSRSAQRAEQAAAALTDEHGFTIRGDANEAVAERAETLFLTVPSQGLRATLRPLARPLAGTLVVSCVNPVAFDDAGPYWERPEAGSMAELCQQLLPESRVAAAFHSVSARKLLALGELLGELEEDVPVCADDDEARAETVALVDAIDGLRGLHAGALRLAFALESMTALLIAVNQHYRRSAGLRFTA